MKKLLCYSSIILLAVLLSGNMYAQQKYKRMKITTKNGLYVEGKNGILGSDKVNLFVNTIPTEYALTDVSLIMAKKGKIGKYAGGFAGGCFAISMIAVIANPNDADVGTLFAGAIIWTGIFAGIGAGIGALADPWKPVYTGQHSSIMNRLDLSFSSYKEAPYNIGVVYKFRH